ncbi:MAG: rhamnogalacturonan acetylesterase [Bacteroidaceae bacterium]|nr:rhamnogalacturonan acetylesterase [Bacteroidaceae bacterium]
MRLPLIVTALLLAAATTAASAQNRFEGVADENHVVDLTLDSLEKANTMRPEAGSSRKGTNPVLFLVGNSTMRTGTMGNGDNGQWGWGYFAHHYFDPERITVENHALGGTSSRTFYTRLWPGVKKGIRPGDYVIIELGHNDNGPFDSGRCRATIKGISPTDSLTVTLKEGPSQGQQETVYTYGEYLRRYVRETRALGAHPILFSLTPRHGANDSGMRPNIRQYRTTFDLWARQVAEEMNVPFVDLSDISATKYGRMSEWKFKHHFYLDNIHTSKFGAELNARSAAEGIAASTHPELQPLRAMQVNVALPTTGVRREEGKPVVFITGDSTVKNADKDSTGMWGWGSQAGLVFDADKITWVNCAQAGRSSRTYLKEGRWDKVYNDLRPGDFVLIQFGHNNIGELHKGKHRGEIPGTRDTSCVSRVETEKEHINEVVYSFGWYLKKFIDDCREKGATPILVSLTPRNEWPDGKHIERRNDSFGKWYREVAAATGCELLDLHNITADALDALGPEAAKAYYNNDHTHTSLAGARLNAQGIAEGLRRNNSPLAPYLK